MSERLLWSKDETGEQAGLIVVDGLSHWLKLSTTRDGVEHFVYLNETQEAILLGTLKGRRILQDARDQLAEAVKPFLQLPQSMIEQAIAQARNEIMAESTRRLKEKQCTCGCHTESKQQ